MRLRLFNTAINITFVQTPSTPTWTKRGPGENHVFCFLIKYSFLFQIIIVLFCCYCSTVRGKKKGKVYGAFALFGTMILHDALSGFFIIYMNIFLEFSMKIS